MGIINFFVPQPERITPTAVSQCYMQGIEEVPWQSKNRLDGQRLTIHRSTGESGQLFIPWTVSGRGLVTLCTACLRESNTIYHLPLELARGTVGRLRNQVAHWRLLDLPIPDAVLDRMTEATHTLRQAATSPRDSMVATEAAERAITEALDTIELLIAHVSTFALNRSGKRNVFLGANLGTRSGHQFPSDLLGAINTVVVPFSWKDVEGSDGHESLDFFNEQIRWGQRLGLKLCGGPLLNFNANGLPDWLYLWEEDLDSLQTYMLRYVESIVERFARRVSLWHAWAGLNSGPAMALDEEFRLRVGVAALETIKRLDPSTPTFVSFSQPFGEYLSRQALDLAPIHYADTLVRADLGIAGFGLELNLGYWPHGTLPRDLLEIMHLIDRWSTLGLPLVMIINIPGRTGDPPNDRVSVMPWGTDVLDEEHQARLASELIRACLAKPLVNGVIWNQLVDEDLPDLPNSGLFWADGTPKPIVKQLKHICQTLLS